MCLLVVHEMTTLPTVTLDEFKAKTGGVHAHSHKDSEHSHQYYEGAPRVGGPDAAKGTSATGHPGTHHRQALNQLFRQECA
jgi:hypothetical protein